MTVASPALGQQATTTEPTTAPTAQAAPAAPADQAAPMDSTAAAPATAATPAPTETAASTAQPATGDQVTSIVDAEFASYDKDGNGDLNKAEFAAWMDALKSKAPGGADKPGDAKWNEAAFAQADKDKSTSVSKQELTGFLGSPAKAG
ncbi:EF-hand domain-containing protein [Sphingomonas sp. NBWT7]|uniref:EF-hand domain-containing protein n=1 Tax=Sphingomonas sp. NBWT7 TaxID=2596913 RepID=UPI00215600A0|nr:EF-hand domain-containing protein [Sphingomonas sp. NBWT7]